MQRDVNLGELSRLRQAYYRFSGALLLYPDAERLSTAIAAAAELQSESESLARFSYWQPWQRLLSTLQGQENGSAERIEEDYVRLFLVKAEAPPYESFFIDPDRQAAGWIAAQLAREYAEKGLTLSPSLNQPPDHVAVELEFMAHLCSVEARAREMGDRIGVHQALTGQATFLNRHLGSWFPVFASRIAAARGGGGLYADIAEAASAFIQHEQDWIALLLEST